MPDDIEIDIEKESASIAADIFGASEDPAPEILEEEAAPGPVNDAVVTPAAPAPRAAPASWAKETHELWAKLDSAAQEQIEKRESEMHRGLQQYKEHHELGRALKDVIAPYRPYIEAQGLDEAKAVASLLNVHYRLTQGTPEQRLSTYQQLGAQLGFTQPQQQTQLPPEIKAIADQVQQLRSALTEREQVQRTQAQDRIGKEVSSFAEEKDDKGALLHPYFDEVAEDIVKFIGLGEDLKDAYEKAVYANPVTRQKEIARLSTEAQTKLRDKAKTEAEAARRASSANVRGRNTSRSPTEPLGTMEDTLKETLAAAKARTH